MKVERRDLIDWENIAMTLHSDNDLSDDELARLKKLLETWPEARAQGTETCPVPIWRDGHDRRTFQFSWEKWFPEAWFEPLAQVLAAEFPSMSLLEIGHNFEPAYRDDTAFITVAHKVVELEDGSRIEVEPFEIAKYTVSIGQFQRFTEETRYKTIAEQHGYETFRNNQFIGDVPAHKRFSLAAFCLSYLDAVAYCEWAKVCLPTEEKWVAAALIDDRICDDDELGRRRSELSKEPAAIIRNSEEMTGTVVDGRRVIVRTGPYLVRSQRDLRSRNRRRRPFEDCEDPIEFRVCK
jgi:hypothetical protein